MTCRSKILLLSIILALSSHFATADDVTIFTVQGPESETDHRRLYGKEVMRLALERTKEKYGAFKIELSPYGSNAKRSRLDAIYGVYENYFVKDSVSYNRLQKMGYVPFPIDRGIVGYRVAFVSPSVKNKLKNVKTLKELKEFQILQGLGWLDTSILQSQGFNVRTVGSYESMFKMISLNRGDLFLRGANELLGEWESHKDLEDFIYDEHVALYYPLPRFFFTAKENTAAIKRVHEGILKAYEDGSLIKAWEELYRPSLDFVKLGERKIFRIENPNLVGIDIPYEQYFYQPDFKQ